MNCLTSVKNKGLAVLQLILLESDTSRHERAHDAVLLNILETSKYFVIYVNENQDSHVFTRPQKLVFGEGGKKTHI